MLLGKDISKTEIGHAAVTHDELHDKSYDDGVVVQDTSISPKIYAGHNQSATIPSHIHI